MSAAAAVVAAYGGIYKRQFGCTVLVRLQGNLLLHTLCIEHSQFYQCHTISCVQSTTLCQLLLFVRPVFHCNFVIVTRAKEMCIVHRNKRQDEEDGSPVTMAMH